ncbi:MAG: DNA-binding protein [Sedimentisphaerales bacterium]|nr:DNA-binding protein [Sedimentisphaerales bacterium]
MPVYNQVQLKKTIIGKLEHGKDLLGELQAVCKEQDILLGRVSAIGAVKKAKIGYYDQQSREYHFFEIDKNLEISNLTGNISIRDNQPMVHAHITLCDSAGNAFGGHLVQGTIVFACEFVIDVYDGPKLLRQYDEITGLPLWKT